MAFANIPVFNRATGSSKEERVDEHGISQIDPYAFTAHDGVNPRTGTVLTMKDGRALLVYGLTPEEVKERFRSVRPSVRDDD